MADTNKDKKKALIKRDLIPEPIRTKPKKKYVRTKDVPKIVTGIFLAILLAGALSLSAQTSYTNTTTPINHRFELKNVIPVEVITTDNETYQGEASFSYLYSFFNVEGTWEQRSESQLESVLVTQRWVDGKMRKVSKKFIPLIEIKQLTIRACD